MRLLRELMPIVCCGLFSVMLFYSPTSAVALAFSTFIAVVVALRD